jgi:S-adenosylmethionine decarboxylase proenzyme
VLWAGFTRHCTQHPYFLRIYKYFIEVILKLNKRMQLGDHLIVDLSGCNQQLLLDSVGSRDLFFNAVRSAGLTIVNEGFYQFSPHGFTCFLLLAESHASLHAWPEYGYCAVDLFTCNLGLDLSPLVEALQGLFGSSHCAVRKLDRMAEIEPEFDLMNVKL